MVSQLHVIASFAHTITIMFVSDIPSSLSIL